MWPIFQLSVDEDFDWLVNDVNSPLKAALSRITAASRQENMVEDFG